MATLDLFFKMMPPGFKCKHGAWKKKKKRKGHISLMCGSVVRNFKMLLERRHIYVIHMLIQCYLYIQLSTVCLPYLPYTNFYHCIYSKNGENIAETYWKYLRWCVAFHEFVQYFYNILMEAFPWFDRSENWWVASQHVEVNNLKIL